MSRRTFAVLASLALLALAGAPRAAARIDRPEYSPGDFWTYRSSLAELVGDFNGTTTIAAGEVTEIQVQGANVTVLELTVEGSGTLAGTLQGSASVSGTWVATGLEHWAVDTWNSVRSYLRLTARGSIQGPQPVAFTFQVANETTRRVTESTFPWPIPDGATGETREHWNGSLTLTIQFEGGSPQSNVTWFDGDVVTAHAQVGTATLLVPAGEFFAYGIEDTFGDGGRRVRWWSPRVGGEVRQEEFNGTGDRVAFSELTSFRYRAAEPPPPFPWLYAIIAGLAAVAGVQLVVLALRRRRPSSAWVPREPDGKSP